MQYRKEIDGLRAIAVVPVILFHAGFEIFRGGYVGVDIFFVISGYLITSIIVKEMQQGTFSISNFYERRARRILPALFFVMISCIPFAWIWMLPSQLKAFSQSLIAVTVFASNFLFWLTSGYFETASEEKPLLHTWSLAVEEQYYVFFPVLIILLWRFGRNPIFYCVVALAILSLVLSEWGWRNSPDFNFYLAPARAWELLAGSICAFLHFGKPQKSNNLYSSAGLGLILFSIFFYDKGTPFPSVYALVPVLGTSLVILFGASGTWVAKLLSLKGFVWVGLISYSAYLWHQPLFAFARIRSIHEPERWLMLSLAISSLLLAYISWRFVERPFRQASSSPLQTQRSVFVSAFLMSVLLGGLGLAGHSNNGYPQRLNEQASFYSETKNDKNPNRQCLWHKFDPKQNHPIAGCAQLSSDDQVDVVFLGDSHSHAISYQAQELLLKNGVSSYAAAYAGCIGLKGFQRIDKPLTHRCDEFNKGLIDYATKSKAPTIVLTSRFTLYWDGSRFKNSENGTESGEPGYIDLVNFRQNSRSHDDPIRKQRVLNAYIDKIKLLADKFNVILVYPIPEAGWDVPSTMAKLAITSKVGTDISLSTSTNDFIKRNSAIIGAFDSIQHENLYRVKPHKVLCDSFISDRCINAIGQDVFYTDDDHLSNAGARLIAPLIQKQLDQISAHKNRLEAQ